MEQASFKRIIGFLFLLISLGFTGLTFAQDSITPDSENTELNSVNQELPTKCQGCPHAKACFEEAADTVPLRSYLWPVPFLLIAAALSFYKKLSYKNLIVFSVAVLAVYAVQQINRFSEKEPTIEERHEEMGISGWNDSTLTAGDEFPDWEESEAKEGTASTTDEFAPITDSDDEFESFSDDEFESFDASSADVISSSESSLDDANREKEQQKTLLKYIVPILLITLLTGILSRFRITRKLRLFFLLGGLIYMGFYNGGCPCMISSFQDFVMWLFGAEVFWGTMLWFVGLMVITYFFGRVWCSWFCHLGALQEFIYKARIIKPLKSEKAQKVFIWMRIVTMLVLLIQIALTHTNIFIHYDPFKVAFNLFSTSTTGYVLLVILLVSSLLINRPFCRGFCPVGLAMGWVTRIPGASVLKPDHTCIGCKVCSNECDEGAIVRIDKISVINNAECIRCGDCQDNCVKSSLKVKAGNGEIEYACKKK